MWSIVFKFNNIKFFYCPGIISIVLNYVKKKSNYFRVNPCLVCVFGWMTQFKYKCTDPYQQLTSNDFKCGCLEVLNDWSSITTLYLLSRVFMIYNQKC